MCINVRARWSAAHSAVADGPSGLQPLKWEPGDERPAFAGLSAGASSAEALDEEDVGAHAQQQDRSLTVAESSIAAVDDLPTVAPATGAPPDSPSKEGRSVRRVAPGDCSPGAPTDPDVRNSRIRLIRARSRYVTFRRMIRGAGSANRFSISRMRSHESTPAEERRLSQSFQMLTTSQTKRWSATMFPGRPKYP